MVFAALGITATFKNRKLGGGVTKDLFVRKLYPFFRGRKLSQKHQKVE